MKVTGRYPASKCKRHLDIVLGKMLQPTATTELDTSTPYIRAANVQWGQVDWSDLKEMWFSPTDRKKYTLKDGDLVVLEGGDAGRCAILQDVPSKLGFQNSIHRVRARKGTELRFAYYWMAHLKSFGYLDLICSKATLAHFTGEKFAESPFPILDQSTQREIADFLDRETARINLLIEKKQKLVKLLGERHAVMFEAKLGAVDRVHIHRLKFAIHQVEQGWSPQCEDTRVEGEKWGVLKLGAITTGTYLEEQHKALPEGIQPIPSLRVKAGDVLVARASGSPRLVGKAAFVETANLNLMLSDKHFRLVPNLKKVLPEYLVTVVNSGKSRSQIEDRLSSAEGMARNIGQNVIYGLRCPFPPLAIQKEILSVLQLCRISTDAIVSKTNSSIERLKEYRTALITAAVTGQIDVTTYTKSGTTDRRLDAIQEEMST